METSAMNDINVEEAFMRICKDVHERIEKEAISGNNNNNKNNNIKNNRPGASKSQTTTTTITNPNSKPKSKGWC